jgi:hypothetical protein
VDSLRGQADFDDRTVSLLASIFNNGLSAHGRELKALLTPEVDE